MYLSLEALRAADPDLEGDNDRGSSSEEHDNGSSLKDNEANVETRPAKRIRLSPAAHPASDQDPQEVISELKAYIDELHDFIGSAGLASSTPGTLLFIETTKANSRSRLTTAYA